MKTVKQYFVTCVETVECEACGGTGRISIATDYATTGSGTITSRCLYCDAGQRQTSSWIELSEALRDLGMVKGLTATAACGNCHESWPCRCSDPVWNCGICAGDQYQCTCDERSYDTAEGAGPATEKVSP